MRRTIFPVLITVLTFAVGVGAAFIWFANKSDTPAEAISTSNPKSISQLEWPELSTCDLANNPIKYDGRIVRVKAKLYFFIHGFSFFDPSCADEHKQIGVKFNDRNSQIEDKLNKEAKPIYGYGMPVIVAIGKFERVTPSRKSDALIDNAYLTFEIYEIEKIILDDIKK